MEKRLVVIICLLLLLTGCLANSSEPTAIVVGTITVMTEPTPTERPLALRVNGEGVWIEEYQASMQQIQHAQSTLGIILTEEEASKRVTDDLIETMVLEQEAYASGFILDEEVINQEISDIIENLGGEDNFNSWLSENGYTYEIFVHAYKKAEAAGWQIDKITAAVPTTTEQIHARQILTINRENAEDALGELNNGYDFTALAGVYDPLTRGDLGWFPRGYLLQPLVEEAAFNLEVGSYSGIIETSSGYHIIYIIEREAERELSQDALLTLQNAALENWLREKVASSSVEIFVP